MSAILFKDDVLFLQRILSSSGFYNGPRNGVWSAKLDDAEAKFFAESERIKSQIGQFDQRTEKNIMSLIPAAQEKARQFMKAVQDLPLTYKIISGTRTYAEQDALYRIGRTVQKDHRVVTKARGGQSNHNFGIAWDIGIFDGGKYYTGDTRKEEKAYIDLGALIKANVTGLEWGGDWTSIVDRPHYQLATGKTVSQVRDLLEKGKAYV